MDNSYNNGFDNKDYTLNPEALDLPGGNFGEFKRSSSRSHLALFLYLLTTNAIAYGIMLIISVIIGITGNEELVTIFGSSTFSIIVSSAAQYVFALPLAVLLMHVFVKPRKYEKTKIKFSEILMLFVIAEAFMIIGSLISTFLKSILGVIFDFAPSNTVEQIVNETPVYLIFIVMVILAPIAEELIFRKFLIDRIGHFGDGFAILISAVAFALMHTNIDQFVYAFLVGLIFGYIYTRTRDVRYTISMHAILNFLGSVVALYVGRAQERVMENMNSISTEQMLPELTDALKLGFDLLLVSLYSMLQYGMLIGGIVLFIVYVSKRRVVLHESAGTKRLAKPILKAAFINPGAITFVAFCVILTVLMLILGG